MKKTLLFALLLAIPFIGFAQFERNVCVEVGTGTWCQYCPGAALGVDDLDSAYGSRVVPIENHNGDIFAFVESDARNSFYGITGYPTAVFDGMTKSIGGSHTQSMYPNYNPIVQSRFAVPSPLDIQLAVTFNASTWEGTVTATVINGTTTLGKITGKIHFVVLESHIPYSWQGQSVLDFVNRDMLPDAQGTDITINKGDTVVVEKDFTIDQEWPSNTHNITNFEIACFVQEAVSYFPAEVYQAARTGIVPDLSAEIVDTKIKSEDGLLHPGQTSNFVVTLLNSGEDSWASMSGVLSTADNNVQVVDSLGEWDAADPGEEVTNDDNSFKLKLKSGAPDGYSPVLNLTIEDNLGRGQELVGFEPFKPGISEDKGSFFNFSIPSVVSSNGVAAISVASPTAGRLDIFDASGRLVKNLYNGHLSAGANILPFSVDNLATGTYFIKLNAGERSTIKKLVVVR
ncbi:Omp28-related outer membrane protein [bacterium]|nr:Omp28-related outer membrane protein [bacterium]